MRYLCLMLMVGITITTSAQKSASGPDSSQAVYYELAGIGLFSGSVNYDYTYHVHPYHAIRPRIGLAFFQAPFIVGDINYMVGNGRHYGEIGVGATTFFLLTGEPKPDLYLRPGYRFISKHGLVLTGAVYITTVRGEFDESPLWIPGVGVGKVF